MESEKMVNISDLCRVLRSKNAKVFSFTVDLMFKDAKIYDVIKKRNLLDKDVIVKCYNIPQEDLWNLEYLDNVYSVKFTIRRPVRSGEIGDSDIYAAQAQVPILQLSFPAKWFKEQ